jgi:hypothetical protein
LALGKTSKTFAVLINEDSLVEGTETFKVNLGQSGRRGFGPAGHGNYYDHRRPI